MKDEYITLEFDKILNNLVKYSKLSLNHDRILELRYYDDKVKIEEELAKTNEAMKLITKFGTYSFGYVHNIYATIEKASKNGVLDCEELYRVASQTTGIQALRSFYSLVNEEEYPQLHYYFNSLVELKQLKYAIEKAIGPDLTVLDNASSNLSRIRKEIIRKNSEVRKKMDSYVKSLSSYLTDSIVTIRNDRLVIPVKAAYKNMVGGIIHDESASLQTCFIEPDGIVSINNAISSLKVEEREEIEKILRNLSALVTKDASILKSNLDCLKELDFILAKGSYGLSYDGMIASINEDKTIVLKGAKHPLIDKKKVVANDFELGGENPSIYIITGPNTGGKTVALKLVGLLCMMSQAGLAIPVSFGATVPVFENFFVDIGDDQDLQESLSTFSSHMTKLVDTIEKCDDKSLVILDELGGGTDPVEGESLAMASIEYFHEKGCIMLASTHYANLKSFAVDMPYILNVSMMFDEQTLHPTYKLLKGVSGKSYGFEIAKSLNYPTSLIEKAKSFKNKYQTDVSRMTEKLEAELIKAASLQRQIELKEEEIKNTEEALKKKQEHLANEASRIQEKADEIVQEKVEKYISEVEKIVDELKSNPEKKLHNAIEAKTKIKNLQQKEVDDSFFEASKEVKVGDRVEIKNIQRIGVVESISKDSCTVSISGKSLTVKLVNVRKTQKQEEKVVVKKASQGHDLIHVNAECNLIGMRAEEALNTLEKYIDSCIRVNLKTCRIIHGYGMGVLKEVVWTYLKKCKYVKSFTFGGAYDGGMGATVVEFK